MESGTSNNKSLRSIALGLLGTLIGGLLFTLGLGLGIVLSQPGGVLASGLTANDRKPAEAGLGTDTNPAPSSAANGQLNQRLVNDVLRRLRGEFYGDLPSNDKLTDGAIRGMVTTLGDPFTQYVEPSLARMMEQDISGKFEGIGASLRSVQGGAVQIVRVFKNSPAERAGVQANDFIESVDGRNVNGLGTTEVAALVRGTSGTTVTLKLRRGEQPRPFDLTITRGEIVIPLTTAKMVGADSDIAYVSLFDFSAQASKQLNTDLKTLLEKNPKGLILDLRDNPGGLVSQAIEIGDVFLDKNVFLIQRDNKGNKKTSDTSERGVAQDIPLVVLVNGGSASASEIVAGAIQDYGRATLIGETTYGKGSVQSPQSLSNGGQLRITIERWYTPKDRAINGTGIKPDYVVELTPDDQKAGRDPQLDAAVEFLKTGKVK
jgi:carboxyl-terminal processing protease